MCNILFNPRLSPVTAVHANELSEIFPQEKDFISDIFEVMTNCFRPQVDLLVMFAGLKSLLKYDSYSWRTECGIVIPSLFLSIYLRFK